MTNKAKTFDRALLYKIEDSIMKNLNFSSRTYPERKLKNIEVRKLKSTIVKLKKKLQDEKKANI